MCGRFMQERPVSDLAEIFGAEPLIEEPGGRYNIAPTDEAIVVVERDDRRALTAYRWGLIPHWAEDARIASRTFNARAESVATMPAFRESFRRRRCLVPVDGFYEWRREGTARRPYRIFRADGRPLALAGLWSGWRNPDTDEVRRTFTIVTTTPNAVVASLHDRMPVIVPDDAWARWLDPTPAEPGELRALLEPTDAVPLEIAPASRLVNDVRHDGPELLLALD
ncbi:MAG TPA: SOS response-associated peptidase [Clostridia bacterium]|nr:SOS response-associated peptidase [Clostridia bacterium]